MNVNDNKVIKRKIDKINTNDETVLWETYYNKYFYDLFNKAISMYEWEGLPKGIDYRFVERVLMSDGDGVFFHDDKLGYVFTRVVFNGKLDIYYNMADRRGYAVNGLNVALTESNSVVCYNTYMRRGVMEDIMIYAKELADIKMTMHVNRMQQKTPLIVTADEDSKLTATNLIQRINGFAHAIFKSRKNMNVQLDVLNLDVPYLLDKLQEDFNNRYNEALTFLGIESSLNKRERLLSEEIIMNSGDTETQRYTYLNARRQCAEQLKELFNWDVKVNFRSNITSVDTDVRSDEEIDLLKKEGGL